MTEEIAKKKGKYVFDLSDGFGRDDVFAVFAAIWNFFIAVLKIILYPYVWIFRMGGRCIRFVRVKDPSKRGLNEDEMLFMESIPTFFVLIGFFGGLILGLFVVYLGSDTIAAFLESFSLDTLINSIAWWLNLIIEIILRIIGLDTGKAPDRVERFGILDIIQIIFDLIQSIFTSDPYLLFIGIGLVGIILAVIWILISETGIITKIISTISKVINYFVITPDKIFSKWTTFFRGFNNRLSAIVIGRERMENRNVVFHRKILFLSLALGAWTFLGGLFVLASSAEIINDPNIVTQITFILIILLGVGFGVGVLEIFLIVRFLDTVSRGGYIISDSVTYKKDKQ